MKSNAFSSIALFSIFLLAYCVGYTQESKGGGKFNEQFIVNEIDQKAKKAEGHIYNKALLYVAITRAERSTAIRFFSDVEVAAAFNSTFDYYELHEALVNLGKNEQAKALDDFCFPLFKFQRDGIYDWFDNAEERKLFYEKAYSFMEEGISYMNKKLTK